MTLGQHRVSIVPTLAGVLVAAVLATMVAAPAAEAAPGDVIWTRQFGTNSFDQARGVAVGPDGSVYVAGHTLGALDGGGGSQGLVDAFVRKYDAGGNVVWTRQFGTSSNDVALGVAVGPDGSVNVAGWTNGALEGGGGSQGGRDAFVRKYSPEGSVVWTRQFGTGSSEEALGVAVGPDGSVYVGGHTSGALEGGGGSQGGRDAFVRKYDAGGNVVWTRQFGTSSNDQANGVAVGPDGSVYVAGETGGALDGGGGSQGGGDAFVRKYTPDGSVDWTRQFGTSDFDVVDGVAVGADGSVYAAGETRGALDGGDGHHGGGDAFMRKYSPEGSVDWTRQFGTASSDVALGVAVGPDGSVYVAGSTVGALEGGGGHQGGRDAFVRTYSADGEVVWTRQFGTPSDDFALGVAVGPDGSVYAAGWTTGALEGGGGHQGGRDAFVVKFDGALPPTVGLVDPTQGRWHLRNHQGQTTSFFFGNPGDVPFMGDWNCDGIATPGLYRQSDGFVYLRNSNSQGVADITFFFGDPGDFPIVGDFNGDGCDTVSIYRASNQTFFIINALGQDGGGLGAAEFSYVFGDPGDKPFTGDFNGDGITTVGLHRESTGFVYYRNTHTQGIADNQFFFGDPADRFVTGDWNGNGIDTPAVFRPSNTTFFFRFTNTQGVADLQFPFGEPPFLPVAGHFGLD